MLIFNLSLLTSTSLPLTNILTLRASMMCSDVKATLKGNALCLSDYYSGPCLNCVRKVPYLHLKAKRTKKHKWSYTKISMKLSLWVWLHSLLIHKKVAAGPGWIQCFLLTWCNLILAPCTAVTKVRTVQKCSTILINYKWWICSVWQCKSMWC